MAGLDAGFFLHDFPTPMRAMSKNVPWQPVADGRHLKAPVLRLLEAVARVVVARHEVDFVVLGSEGESGVDDQSLGSSDAEVGMEEKNFDHFRHKLDSGNNYFSILHHFFRLT